MGKQKKGSAASNKKGKAQKEKKQLKKERRAQANAQAKAESSHDDVERIFRELRLENSLLVGRMYYYLPDVPYDRSNVNTYRGILKQVIGDVEAADDETSTAVFQPVVPLDDSDELRVTVPLRHVIRQQVAWTLRFEVGDAVVAYDEVTDKFVEATIEHCWPVWWTPNAAFGRDRTENLVLYQCRTMDGARRAILVSEDTDYYIQKIPTSFRFAPGDRVMVSTDRALFPDDQGHFGFDEWQIGTVTDTHILNQTEYVCYKCELDPRTTSRGRPTLCYVLGDSVAFIYSATASPRETLFAAMEDQHFLRKDFDSFIERYGIDVSIFFDLFVAKAIENASYGALCWLDREHKDFIRKNVRDADDNGLLHQLARSPCVIRFLECASKYDSSDVENGNYMFLWVHALKPNTREEFWIDDLVRDQRVPLRTLEFALSPEIGLGRVPSELYYSAKSFVFLERLQNLVDASLRAQRFEVARMLEYLLFTYPVYSSVQASSILAHDTERVENDLESGTLLERFKGDGKDFATFFVQVLYEMCRRHDFDPFISAFFNAARGGCFRFVELVLDQVSGLSNISMWRNCDATDRGDFLQEYFGDWTDMHACTVSLIDAVAMHRDFSLTIGRAIHSMPSYTDRRVYYDTLQSLSVRERGDSFIESLRSEAGKCVAQKSLSPSLLTYRSVFLDDDSTLANRRKVMGILMNVHGVAPPSPVNLIRWRQCGVLRWLESESIVDLKIPAKAVKCLGVDTKLRFAGGRAIHNHMTLAEYLCFACVEYDDILSLQWLVKERGVNITTLTCNGWNICHAVASFGRAEMVVWLEDANGFETLATAHSQRRGEEKKLPVHLAMESGHSFVADRLVRVDEHSSDKLLASVIQVANKSQFENVKEWVQRREKPMELNRDIQVLRRLLHEHPPAWSKIESHIEKSRCLDVEAWYDSDMWVGHERFKAKGWNIDVRYTDFLLECICVSQCGSNSFVTALVTNSLRPKSTMIEYSTRSVHHHFMRHYRVGTPEAKPFEIEQLMLELQRMSEDYDFTILLRRSRAWMSPHDRSFHICDPVHEDPIFSLMYEKAQEATRTSELHPIEKVRDKLLKLDFLSDTRERAKTCLDDLILRGFGGASIDEVVSVYEECTNRLAFERGTDFTAVNQSWSRVLHDRGVLNASHVMPIEKYETWFKGFLLLSDRPRLSLHPIYRVLAVEDYSHLTMWLLQRPTNLTGQQELEMTRVSAFFGSQKTLDLFLLSFDEILFQSSRLGRIHAAMLGAAEAGKLAALDDYYALAENSLPVDDFIVEGTEGGGSESDGAEERADDETGGGPSRTRSDSITVCAVHGYLSGCESADHEGVCRWLALNGAVSSSLMLAAACSILHRYGEVRIWERFLSFYTFLLRDLSFDPVTSFKYVDEISNMLCPCLGYSDLSSLHAVALSWVSLLVETGVDFQHYNVETRELSEASLRFQDLRLKQLYSWTGFDIIEKGYALEDIKVAVDSEPSLLRRRSRGGLTLAHLAVVYDRLDVLRWLVEERDQELDCTDNEGRDLFTAAKASGSASVGAWIESFQAKRAIALFLTRNVRRRVAYRRRILLLSSIRKLQAWSRCALVTRKYRNLIVSRLDASSAFQRIWSPALGIDGKRLSDSVWSTLHERHADVTRSDAAALDPKFQSAVEEAISEETEDTMSDAFALNEANKDGHSDNSINVEIHDDDDNDVDSEFKFFSELVGNLPNADRFTNQVLLTGDVLKWCRKFDTKYVSFFVRRITQLASGDRSRILAKRLKGSLRTAIFETYLEQKSGHRILWTVQASGDVLVWYVVKHKEVSRYADLISSSLGRSHRQLADAVSTLAIASVESDERTAVDDIVLDPMGNTPIKLYTVTRDHADSLTNASWTPPLRLTPEERAIVEETGTSLLLGRSGTGKTICLCNKIDFDRHWHESDDSFSQLFVARSGRLSRLVTRTVGDTVGCTFSTYQELLSSLENALCNSSGSALFLPSQKVDFALFKRDVYRDPKLWDGVDALVIWTNIRSFIKGSIDALSNPERILTLEDYISVEKLGRKRCRISLEHRPVVYKAFLAYHKYITETGRWDDCDRVSYLLRCLQTTKDTDPERFDKLRYSKVYVDEVQDYTQAEILLFFYLSRPGDLFLCGDPAQSVVEGVEFRFEEVRSVAHFVAGTERRHLVPQKPMTLHVNFRSHAGILNVAAAVLSRMFTAFPDSAKQLKEDRGLFLGPRPSVLYKADANLLNSALLTVLSGSTVLIHDDQKLRCTQRLNGYRLMYGIREAKGLEFKNVILFDFFAGIPKALQKPWRDLLLGREGLDFASRYPEVEGQLKLLYTAITRTIDRLLFVETIPSIAGEAFSRWSTTTTTRATFRTDQPLAVRQRVSDVESLQLSVDEWVVAGLENAEAADASPDTAAADSFLLKALHCFEQANDASLAAKARTHRSSVRFRSDFELKVAQDRNHASTVEEEVSVARLLSQLFREELWLEGAKVCRLVLPHLPEYTQNQLRVQVLPKLPEVY